MNQLTDAYMALKHALPLKEDIKSKKQIIVQVRYCIAIKV